MQAFTSGGCIQGTATARGSPADDQDIELPAGLQGQDLLLSCGEMLLPHWSTFCSLNLPQGTLQRWNIAREALAWFCTRMYGGTDTPKTQPFLEPERQTHIFPATSPIFNSNIILNTEEQTVLKP